MVRQLTFSEITNQRTLTESTDTTTDDTPETPTDLLDRARQHATNIAVKYFPDLLVEAIDWRGFVPDELAVGGDEIQPFSR
ncbi:hypothetical protein SAMN05421858_4544 [Haladaptatus litoreus]|uniref:Uncharacterized protein n=1 Tax=Haladaptatus litoreus TaxID=553468 RepID=A0A1N7EW71_9EURY|nr:hypothetical protein [Haladaptatus litoreus]SIR92185.1 hypothetical protein SAMN05421858_4544 [Haladaptatus litoreus]